MATNIGLAIIAALLLAGTPSYRQGVVCTYRPGLMEQVASTRGYDLRGYVDGVALDKKEYLGREVWIEFEWGWVGPFLVVDYLNPADKGKPPRGWAVDVGARTYRMFGLPYGTYQVKIFIGGQPCQIPSPR